MAIYNNREVTFLAPVRTSHQADSVTVIYTDGTHENVPVSQVRFTEAEKKQLLKDYPSKFDDVQTIKDEDVKAVRIGVAPSYDSTYREQAEREVLAKKQAEENKKQLDAAKAEAEKSVNKKLETKGGYQATPQSPTGVYQGKAVL